MVVTALDRLTMAQRAAEHIRDLIRDGSLSPGQAVPEASTAADLGISRNTVREAFRLLGGEGLVVHNIHRGIVVKQLSEQDVRDIYTVRRSLELGALRPPPPATPRDLEALRATVADAEAAIVRSDWQAVSTLNLEFHRRLVGLRRSPRLDTFFTNVLAELRLAFATVPDQPAFLRPYVDWNLRLWRMLALGQWADAARELESYLADSERAVVAAIIEAHA